jgi:hypothetical protein
MYPSDRIVNMLDSAVDCVFVYGSVQFTDFRIEILLLL